MINWESERTHKYLTKNHENNHIAQIFYECTEIICEDSRLYCFC
jgi:hypothetical protein